VRQARTYYTRNGKFKDLGSRNWSLTLEKTTAVKLTDLFENTYEVIRCQPGHPYINPAGLYPCFALLRSFSR
jgi:hypothetical protein